MRSIWIGASISALAVIGIADVGYSQGQEFGKFEYLNSCASCHGPAGKGDGSVANSLKGASKNTCFDRTVRVSSVTA
jgi:cytochrome c553